MPAHLCKFSCQRAAWGVWDALLSDLVLLPRSHGLLCKAACQEPVGDRRELGGSPKTPTNLCKPVRAEHPILLCQAAAGAGEPQPLLPPRVFLQKESKYTSLNLVWDGFFFFQSEGFTQTCFLAGVFNGLVYVSLTKIYAGIKGSWVNLPGLFEMHSL